MNKAICVYCSSSNSINEKYFECANSLGRQIAERKDLLVYGGSKIGLMGEVANSVRLNGGKVIGVIPEILKDIEIVNFDCDELITADNVRERKAIMEEKSDAFIALPGGFGTLEELLEIITAKILKQNNKPIVILNVDNFYDGMLKQFEKIFEDKFANPDCRKTYLVTENIETALEHIDNYKPFDYGNKWFDIHTTPRK